MCINSIQSIWRVVKKEKNNMNVYVQFNEGVNVVWKVLLKVTFTIIFLYLFIIICCFLKIINENVTEIAL